MRGAIHFIEKNIYGAWVVYGIIGVKQYYYYTKKQADTGLVNRVVNQVLGG